MSREISPAADPPLDGTKYRLLALLGRGGMGQVWLAEHVALGADVVVKVLHPEHSNRPDLNDRLRLEAQALGQLRHANIVSVIDTGTTASGGTFVVMERLLGKTLSAELAKRRSLSVPEALRITAQLLEGLAVAHDAGIVHRDIKPSNVLLCRGTTADAPPTVKIIDFGIAKVVGVSRESARVRPLEYPTEAGEVLGTPTALSPEQTLGRAVDARSDVYAVGLVVYRMLTGRHPFAGYSGAELVRAYASRTPSPPSRESPEPVDEELDALVLRALSTDPSGRYSSAREFLHAVQNYLERPRNSVVAEASSVSPPVSDLDQPEDLDLAAQAKVTATTDTVDGPKVAGLAPTQLTRPIATSEVAALNGVFGSTETARPLLDSAEIPVTRTAFVPLAPLAPLVAPSPALPATYSTGRFIAVATVTAFAVVTALALVFWR